MLRFGDRLNSHRRPPGRQTRGVWVLLVMLGAVLLLMRQLQEQATVDYLGRVFTARPADPRLAGQRTPAVPTGRSGGIWDEVQDNAMFLPGEQAAWQALLAEAQHTPRAELAQKSLGEIAYAQLVNQPEVYRGEVVRLQGYVLRAAPKQLATGDGKTSPYYQLVVAPKGGGQWPFIVYVPELPAQFPHGDGLREPVVIDGLFFKNWSYSHGGGFGLAPVLVAGALQWSPPVARKIDGRPASNPRSLGYAAAGAALVALSVTWWIQRQTRRPSSPAATPDFKHLEAPP
ncbi:MAG: hypothetical protein IT424_09935 [Pirellulales bacterium]|nr:hypothetical protein [Pirellulales bacterium]